MICSISRIWRSSVSRQISSPLFLSRAAQMSSLKRLEVFKDWRDLISLVTSSLNSIQACWTNITTSCSYRSSISHSTWSTTRETSCFWLSQKLSMLLISLETHSPWAQRGLPTMPILSMNCKRISQLSLSTILTCLTREAIFVRTNRKLTGPIQIQSNSCQERCRRRSREITWMLRWCVKESLYPSQT